MTKPSKEVEKIEQLLAGPWAVDIEELWQQAAHNPDKDLRKRITSTSRRYFNALRNNDGKHEPVKNAENYLYGTMQNIGVDTGNYSLGYVATWAKDKAVIHSALSEIQQVSNKVIELSDGLTKQLGLQEAPKEPEHDLKKLSAQELNKSYQGLQQQVQQTTSSQQKAQFKNQLHEIHEEISNRTQKQLQAFAEQNPEIKQPKSELDQSLKR